MLTSLRVEYEIDIKYINGGVMGPFEMIAIIVVVSVIAGSITKIVQAKNSGATKEEKDVVDRLQNEVNHLKDRVKTLEALVTDESYRVKAEIERL